jgi:glutamate dehydrogenase/leucine dehydrogenase
LGIAEDLRTVVRTAYREVQVQIPVRLRHTGIHVFSGYRVQHNGARGHSRAASATRSSISVFPKSLIGL